MNGSQNLQRQMKNFADYVLSKANFFSSFTIAPDELSKIIRQTNKKSGRFFIDQILQVVCIKL